MILTTIGFVFGSNISKKMFSISGGKKAQIAQITPNVANYPSPMSVPITAKCIVVINVYFR